MATDQPPTVHPPAITDEKIPVVSDHIEKGPLDEDVIPPPQYDPAFVKRTMWKVSDNVQIRLMSQRDLIVMPLVVGIYLFCSLDRSNLANAKTLGMVADIGGDPTGANYALINAM